MDATQVTIHSKKILYKLHIIFPREKKCVGQGGPSHTKKQEKKGKN